MMHDDGWQGGWHWGFGFGHWALGLVFWLIVILVVAAALKYLFNNQK